MMRPLVLRPSPQGEKLCQILTEHGYVPYFTPLLEITLLPLPDDAASQIKQVDFIVITSQHCVAHTASLLQKSAATLFAIGPATATKLAEQGLSAIYPTENPSTETLFPLITQHIPEISGKSGLLLQGKDPRIQLTQMLHTAGVHLQKIDVYARTPVPIDFTACCQHWMTHQINSVIITSGDLLYEFVKILKQGHAQALLTECVAYVVSTRLTQQAKDVGFKQVVLTQGASDAAILHALGTHS